MTEHEAPSGRAKPAAEAATKDLFASRDQFVLTLCWTCQTCGWTTIVDAPGFGGDGRWHYEQPGNRKCGPITAQKVWTRDA